MGPCYVTNKVHILEHWTAHFSQLLNRPSAVDEQAPNDLPQRPLISTLDETPMQEETIKAIRQLQTGIAPGSDEMPPEIGKVGGETIINWLTSLFQAFSERGELRKILKMPTSYICTKTRVRRLLAITTDAYLSSTLQKRS